MSHMTASCVALYSNAVVCFVTEKRVFGLIGTQRWYFFAQAFLDLLFFIDLGFLARFALTKGTSVRHILRWIEF